MLAHHQPLALVQLGILHLHFSSRLLSLINSHVEAVTVRVRGQVYHKWSDGVLQVYMDYSVYMDSSGLHGFFWTLSGLNMGIEESEHGSALPTTFDTAVYPPTIMEINLEDLGCVGSLADRKYFDASSRTFIKRTLRRSEWTSTSCGSLVVPSTTLRYRLENEAASLEYIARNTNIPVPALRGVFQDDGAFYLMTEHVDGVPMSELSPADKDVVSSELQQHLETLRSLRSDRPGIPGKQLICPHYRLFRGGWQKMSVWRLKDVAQNDHEEYVFCHNDLGQHNVMVDPETLRIRAIIDWEFSGFFPRWFEAPFWEQPGPAPTLGDEDRLREWLVSSCDKVEVTWPDAWLS